jgi:hypothetical protein
MPPQNPSDQAYPEQARWNGSQQQGRWNGTNVDATQPRSFVEQGIAPTAPPPAEPPRQPTSRRSVLRGVLGVGAVGAAAAVGGGAVFALDRNSSTTAMLKPVSKPVAMAPMAPTAMAGPLVVYIADTTTGLLDVFGGTGATQINNPALVSQLLDNLKLA